MFRHRQLVATRLIVSIWIPAVVVCSLFTVSQASAKDVVLLPGAPTNRVVVYFHGSGGQAEEIVGSKTTDIYLKRGFAVAASDADGQQNWGNPASVAANVRLVRQLRKIGLTRMFLMGGSMGGLDAMQMIGRTHPEAVALVAPVCNLKGVPLIQAAVESEWGKRRPDYLSPVTADPWVGMPVQIWASPEDTWVPKKLNADLCARELRRGGAKVTVKLGRGDHDSPEPIPGWEWKVPNFFSAVARRNR